jgi:hypothetical protein
VEPEHGITDRELADTGSGVLDDARELRSHHRLPGAKQSRRDPGEPGLAPQGGSVGAIDRRGLHTHEHLAVTRTRLIDLPDLEPIRRPITRVNARTAPGRFPNSSAVCSTDRSSR